MTRSCFWVLIQPKWGNVWILRHLIDGKPIALVKISHTDSVDLRPYWENQVGRTLSQFLPKKMYQCPAAWHQIKSVRFAFVSVFETTFKFIFETWLRFAFLSAFRRSVWSRSLAQMQHHIWGGTLRCQTLKLTIYQEIGLIYQSELLGVTIKKRNLQYIVPMKWVSAFSMHCPESS